MKRTGNSGTESKAKCPTCKGTNPAHHPAVQWEGEVQLCRDPWHQPTAAEIEAQWEREERARA